VVAEIDRRTGLEVLDREGCFALLRMRSLARIGVVVDGQPLVFPVNFALDGEGIVFRTEPGTMLSGVRHGPVAFECDGTDDPSLHTAWSILATGPAIEVSNPVDLEHLHRLPLGPWCPGPLSIWLRMEPTTLTGRRIRPHHSRWSKTNDG